MKYAEIILNNEASRCLLCSDAPCTAACPGGFDPARFIRAVRFENPQVGAGYINSAACREVQRQVPRAPACTTTARSEYGRWRLRLRSR